MSKSIELTVKVNPAWVEYVSDVLIEKLGIGGGANYHFIYNDLNFVVWLCDVTLFVFNSFPQTIYIN